MRAWQGCVYVLFTSVFCVAQAVGNPGMTSVPLSKDLLSRAESGSARDEFFVARAYGSGSGVKQDYAQALYWYKRAADRGDDGAITEIGSGKPVGGTVEDGKGSGARKTEGAWGSTTVGADPNGSNGGSTTDGPDTGPQTWHAPSHFLPRAFNPRRAHFRVAWSGSCSAACVRAM